MKANDYKILVRAIEEGIQYGWERVHKHTNAPDKEVIKDEIESAVIDEICLVFDFDEREKDE